MLLSWLIFLLTLVQATLSPLPEQESPETTIHRDVCIIGGGASGTYAAIRLKDLGKSIIIVEKANHLGGHTETLYLNNSQHLEYGVEGVINNNISQSFFRRLGVDSVPLLPETLHIDNVNFRTGQRVPAPSDLLSMVAGMIRYRAAIEKYPFLKEGVYDLPSPVPEELLLPFREFIKTHHCEDALGLIFLFAQNIGNLLDAPTLYAIQNFGIAQINALIHGLIAPRNGMQELYEKAYTILKQDTLLNSAVSTTHRSKKTLRITITDTTNKTKITIVTKNLLITIPPTPKNMHPFNPDKTESDIFARWSWNNYYVAVLTNTGLPDRTTIFNTDPLNTPGNLPTTPFSYRLRYPGIKNHITTELVGNDTFSAADAKNLILSDLHRISQAGTYGAGNPELVAFGSHSPTMPMVLGEDIRGGFYGRLYGLQGRRGTWYSGLSFCSDHAALIWGFTEGVVRGLV